jgi:DNA polymerase-3 subunit alpha
MQRGVSEGKAAHIFDLCRSSPTTASTSHTRPPTPSSRISTALSGEGDLSLRQAPVRVAAGFECVRRVDEQRVAEERASSQASLFGAEEPSARPAFPKAPAWSAQDRLDAERESVGFYLSGHPLSDFFIDAGERYSSYADILEEGETEPRAYMMAGVVRRVQYRPAMSGGTLAFVSMSDPTGDFEGMIMPENVQAARDVMEVGKAFSFRGRVRWRDGDMKLAADSFEPVEAAEARIGDDLRIVLKEGAPLDLLAQTLASLPKAQPGEARPLHLVLRLKDGREIEVNTRRTASGSPAARAALKAARGVERVI